MMHIGVMVGVLFSALVRMVACEASVVYWGWYFRMVCGNVGVICWGEYGNCADVNFMVGGGVKTILSSPGGVQVAYYEFRHRCDMLAGCTR